MKRTSILLALGLLALTACDCPHCGNAKFALNTTTLLISGDADTQTSTPGALVLTSSYGWTATNLAPQYIDFENAEGEGGAFYFSVRLRPQFFDDFNADPSQFEIDATGCKVGRIRFVSSQGETIQVMVYLEDAIILSFDANGATGTPPATRVIKSGEATIIPDDTGLSHPDSRPFLGWNTEANGGGVFYTANTSVVFAVSTTLYAIWNGDGLSPETPKYIYNRKTLMEVENTVTEPLYYLVVADFDANCNDDGSLAEASWKPLGDHNPNRFGGVFDGNGHTITFTINDGHINHIGLFNYIAYVGVVKNLSVTGSIVSKQVSLERSLHCGGIAGISQGLIEGCYSAVSIKGESAQWTNSGGIVGVNQGSTVGCVSTGSIECIAGAGDANAGGIAGANSVPTVAHLGRISYSVSTSSVEGKSSAAKAYVGGIVGGNDDRAGVVNCVAINAVSTSVWSLHANGATESHCGRVAGAIGNYSSLNNADEGMVVWKNGAAFTIPDADKTDTKGSGASITSGAWRTKTWWEGLAGDWATYYGDFELLVTL